MLASGPEGDMGHHVFSNVLLLLSIRFEDPKRKPLFVSFFFQPFLGLSDIFQFLFQFLPLFSIFLLCFLTFEKQAHCNMTTRFAFSEDVV